MGIICFYFQVRYQLPITACEGILSCSLQRNTDVAGVSGRPELHVGDIVDGQFAPYPNLVIFYAVLNNLVGPVFPVTLGQYPADVLGRLGQLLFNGNTARLFLPTGCMSCVPKGGFIHLFGENRVELRFVRFDQIVQ